MTKGTAKKLLLYYSEYMYAEYAYAVLEWMKILGIDSKSP